MANNRSSVSVASRTKPERKERRRVQERGGSGNSAKVGGAFLKISKEVVANADNHPISPTYHCGTGATESLGVTTNARLAPGDITQYR
jgi:hypothetical protein